MRTERQPATATIKIDEVLLRKAKQFAALEVMKLSDYFDRLLRGPVERDFTKAMRKIVEEHGGENNSPTK